MYKDGEFNREEAFKDVRGFVSEQQFRCMTNQQIERLANIIGFIPSQMPANDEEAPLYLHYMHEDFNFALAIRDNRDEQHRVYGIMYNEKGSLNKVSARYISLKSLLLASAKLDLESSMFKLSCDFYLTNIFHMNSQK